MVSLLTIHLVVLQLMQKSIREKNMAHITFRFNPQKALESILYLTPKISDSDVYGICKLLYLADKTSLEKYGRFIFGESYCAMEKGATPSNVYDLLKESTITPLDELEVRGNQVTARRDANLEYLSESDIECLDQVINIWGKSPNWARRDAAHDAAWKKAWDKRGGKGSVGIPVESIAELFDDSDDLITYLSNSENG